MLLLAENFNLLTRDPTTTVGLRELQEAGWDPITNITERFQVVACNANGAYVLAAEYSGRAFVSSNYGETFTEVQPAGDTNKTYQGGSISGTGQYMVLCTTQRTYMSSNYGVDWSEVQPAGDTDKNWQFISINSTGQYILAGNSQRLYLSTNYGSSWSEAQPEGDVNRYWQAGDMSDNGQYMIVSTYGDRIYRSTNYGAAWSEIQPAGDNDKAWRTVSYSGDGQYALAGVYSLRLYLSDDYGATWAEVQPAGDFDQNWVATSISDDGEYMMAAVYNGSNYLSDDNGSSWSQNNMIGGYSHTGTAISSSGVHQYVVKTYGGLYDSEDTGDTWEQKYPTLRFPALINITDQGKFSDSSIELKGAWQGGQLGKVISITGNVFMFQGWVKFLDLSHFGRWFLASNDSGNDKCFGIDYDSNGGFDISDSNGGVVGSTEEGIVEEDIWYYLEIKATIAGGTNGQLLIKIDGTAVFNESDLDLSTTETDVDYFEIGNDIEISELLVLDGSGTKNNDLLGIKARFKHYLPDATTAQNQWSGQGHEGPTYECIDEALYAGHDGDTRYLEASAGGQISRFEVEDFDTEEVTIKAVVVTSVMRKSDSGDCFAEAFLYSNGERGDGTQRTLNEEYTSYQDIYESNPDGDGNFTSSVVDDLQVGVDSLVY